MMDNKATCGSHFENEGSAIGAEAEVDARIAAAIACIALHRTCSAEKAPTFGEIKEAIRPVTNGGMIDSINGLALLDNNNSHQKNEALIRSNDEALSRVLEALVPPLMKHPITAGACRAIKNEITARGRLHGGVFDTQDQYVVGILQYYGLRIPAHDDWDNALVYRFLLNLSYNREHIEDDGMLGHYEDMADACVNTKDRWSVINCLSESRIRTSALIAREHPLEAGGVDGAAILDHLAEKLQDELCYSTASEKIRQHVVENTLTAIFEGPLRGVPASTTVVLGVDALVPDVQPFLNAAIKTEAREGTATTGIPSVSFHASRFQESIMRAGQSAIVTASAVEATSGPFTIPIAGIGTENQRARDMGAMFRMGFAESIPFDAAAVASAWHDGDEDDEGTLAAMVAALASSLDDVVEREKANSGRAASQWQWVATRISKRVEDGLSPERAVLESASHYLTNLRGVVSTDEDYYYDDNGIVNVPQCMKAVHKAAAEICGAEPGRLTLLTRKGVHSIFLHQAALDTQKELWSHRSGIVEEDDGTVYLLHVRSNGEYEERFLEKGGFTCTFYEPDGAGTVASRTVRG